MNFLRVLFSFFREKREESAYIVLKRTYDGSDCTLGELYIGGSLFCKTLENPWLDNRRFLSCIPTGRYVVERVVSPKFGETFEITAVKNRSHILFHWGNFEKDTLGCVLLGSRYGKINGERVVLQSKITFVKFLNSLEEFNRMSLEIK